MFLDWGSFSIAYLRRLCSLVGTTVMLKVRLSVENDNLTHMNAL